MYETPKAKPFRYPLQRSSRRGLGSLSLKGRKKRPQVVPNNQKEGGDKAAGKVVLMTQGSYISYTIISSKEGMSAGERLVGTQVKI